MKTFVVAAGAALSIAAPALSKPGDELAGNSLQVRIIDSPATRILRFHKDGRVLVLAEQQGRRTQEDGRWTVGNGRICFDWRVSPTECWRYPGALRKNQTVRTSRVDGSMQASVTLVGGHAVGQPEPAPRR